MKATENQVKGTSFFSPGLKSLLPQHAVLLGTHTFIYQGNLHILRGQLGIYYDFVRYVDLKKKVFEHPIALLMIKLLKPLYLTQRSLRIIGDDIATG